MSSYWFGTLPEGWSAIKLKHLCQLKTVKESSSNNFVGLENIESASGKYIHSSNQEESANEGIKFCKGDVLFGKLRPYLAKVWEADREGTASSEFLVMSPGPKIRSGFLKILLLSPNFIAVVNGSTFGSKMPRADWGFIGNLWMPVPEVSSQKHIEKTVAKKLKTIDDLIGKHKKSILQLEEYRNTTLNDVITSESSE